MELTSESTGSTQVKNLSELQQEQPTKTSWNLGTIMRQAVFLVALVATVAASLNIEKLMKDAENSE